MNKPKTAAWPQALVVAFATFTLSPALFAPTPSDAQAAAEDARLTAFLDAAFEQEIGSSPLRSGARKAWTVWTT